jgi:hypothetical protein
MRTVIAPTKSRVVDENGMLTPEWVQYFADFEHQQTFHFPDDGNIQATVSSSDIAEMEKEFLDTGNTIRNPKFKQTKLVYNSDTKTYLLNVDGTFKTVNVT